MTDATDSPSAEALAAVMRFPLVEALLGRRARRFAVGAELPDGVLAHKSRQPPQPLSEAERMLVLLAVAGNTNWQHLILRNALYAPKLSNYAGAAGGRTFPSAAGFHTSEIFFTDDSGTYLLPTRDAPALAERDPDGTMDPSALLDAHRGRIRKLSDSRLQLPARTPHFEGHNTWCANVPGSLLVIPVADLAQHHLANLCYLVQNGQCIRDDIHDRPIPGLERFSHRVDLDEPWPLSFMDQYTLMEATVEIGTACYAGMLMLQAVGLGGWMFDGFNPFSVLGASGDPDAPGLGFRYESDPRWPTPNPTGLPGVFEGFCPPHYPDMRSALAALEQRKFGPGGPFHPDTPGPYRDTPAVRAAAAPFDDEFRQCVLTMADYTLDTFGRFPATVPSMHAIMYLQAHHLDLEFYDRHYAPGSYLATHAAHQRLWHGR